MDDTLVILSGDQTGEELLQEALRVLDPALLRLNLNFLFFDLSLRNRMKTENAVVYEAGKAIRKYRLALKAATVTPETKGGVGSPNRILREEMNADVILRTGRRIPGVRPIGGVHAPISVVRMARDDAYGAKEWREGPEGEDGETAFRTEKISRRVCRSVAEYAFRHAERTGSTVFGGPKFTVSPVYEGMFKEDSTPHHGVSRMSGMNRSLSTPRSHFFFPRLENLLSFPASTATGIFSRILCSRCSVQLRGPNPSSSRSKTTAVSGA